MKHLLLSLSILMGLTYTTTSAHAQAVCGPRDSMVKQLGKGYTETQKMIGLAANGSLMEIFTSDISGSWTIMLTAPNDTTCLMAAGKFFGMVKETKKPNSKEN